MNIDRPAEGFEQVKKSLEQTFGDRLRAARDDAGLTARQVATVLGLTTDDMIYRYEKNLAEPTITNLQKMARLYHCDVADFFSGPHHEVNALQPVLDAMVELDPATRLMMTKKIADAVRSMVLLMQWHASEQIEKLRSSESAPPASRPSRPSSAPDASFEMRVGGSRSSPPSPRSTTRSKGENQGDGTRDRRGHRE